jgi:hypothetical protein
MENNKYIEWKNWNESDFNSVAIGSRFYFDQVFNPSLKEKSNILEIGFGNGELIGYFREQGHEVIGIEINQNLVERAKNLGLRAYCGVVWDIVELQSERFDLISAFSVVEHLNHEELTKLFLWARNHLNVDGRMFLVFPEGASPFGLANQNGDFTHVSSLTKTKIESLCMVSNMRILSYKDDFLSSNKLCTFGFPGRLVLQLLQGYASLVKLGLRLLLYPLATSLRLSTNSIAVIGMRSTTTKTQ